jgi:16S rRNA (guanine966-N2)-methyltransferase
MRITGGEAKGRLLATVRGLRIRPTTDLVRQAIFNILGQDLTGVKVLDLFAGTGSLGLEALSRGATSALFVDNSRQSIGLIRKNLALCSYENVGFTLKRDLRKGLTVRHPAAKGKFDLIFLDPPYGSALIPPLLKALSKPDLLSAHARVVAESSKSERLSEDFGPLRMIDLRTYGETRINVYACEGE